MIAVNASNEKTTTSVMWKEVLPLFCRDHLVLVGQTRTKNLMFGIILEWLAILEYVFRNGQPQMTLQISDSSSDRHRQFTQISSCQSDCQYCNRSIWKQANKAAWEQNWMPERQYCILLFSGNHSRFRQFLRNLPSLWMVRQAMKKAC